MRSRLHAAARGAALACVLAALAAAARAGSGDGPCATGVGPCAQPGLPPCGRILGPWQVARSRGSGLPEGRSHSACILAAGPVAIVAQQRGVSGDTLLSRRPAARAERQRARVTLATHGALPDHWVFALAGSFLDRGARTACAGLRIAPPVNAGYAVIGANWQARAHGFYFERLADACVYDGTRPECAGDGSFIPHEFVAGETFTLELALERDGDAWSLAADVALVEDGPDGDRPTRSLGRMRQRVAAPCWLEPGDPGRALVLVIPDHEAQRATPGARVEVTGFAWLG